MFLTFLFTALVVGFVTAGLKIRFDRFFAIIMMIVFMGFSPFVAVNVFLPVLFLGAGYVLWENRKKLAEMPAANKKKFLSVVPLLAFVGAFVGTVLFSQMNDELFMVLFGLIAALYGLRLMFIHFAPHEHDYKSEKSFYLKLCGFFGPLVSGCSVGLFGTSLKALKLPFAVRIGKMNLAQVYLGNTITAFYASFFVMVLHALMLRENAFSFDELLIGISLWLFIHIASTGTAIIFKDKWRKGFQIIIGMILIVVALRFIR